MGNTTEYIGNTFPDIKIKTLELVKQYYNDAKKRLELNKNIEVINVSSDEFLNGFDKGGLTTLYYLDAHWYDFNPLRNELKNIENITDGKDIIIIDDFKVPNRDLAYDPTPEGGVICMDYIKDCLDWNNWVYFYKNESDNFDTKATGQIYIIHKSMKFSDNFIKYENDIPYSNIKSESDILWSIY